MLNLSKITPMVLKTIAINFRADILSPRSVAPDRAIANIASPVTAYVFENQVKSSFKKIRQGFDEKSNEHVNIL